MFQFNKTIIREPMACALLKLQYWRQLKYFGIELFGHVATYYSVQTVSPSALYTIHIPTGLNNMWPHNRTVR